MILTTLSTEGTVRGHVSSILQQLHADNRVQAAIIADEAGMISTG